jgi:hypothetical protein
MPRGICIRRDVEPTGEGIFEMVHHAPSVSVRLDSVASPSDNSALQVKISYLSCDWQLAVLQMLRD